MNRIILLKCLVFMSVGWFSCAFQPSIRSSLCVSNISKRINPAYCQVNSKSRVLSSHVVTMRAGSNLFLSFNPLKCIYSKPDCLFNIALLALSSSAFSLKLWEQYKYNSKNLIETKPYTITNLQYRFLAVFWLLRLADWLQGPYFYEVFQSKTFHGIPASIDIVSKIFLTGFALTGLFGPFLGRNIDYYGRKKGTIAFTLLYTLSALTTRSNNLSIVLAGRVASGLGTSLLFSAPEAWLVGEYKKQQYGSRHLAETFALAYAGDALAAILAGQLADKAAAIGGPSGPFLLSIGFLAAGGILAALTWEENTIHTASSREEITPSIIRNWEENNITSSTTKVTQQQNNCHINNTTAVYQQDEERVKQSSIQSAFTVIQNDRKILFLGLVQALFESAMYIFVLQWPVLMKSHISKYYIGSSTATATTNMVIPYGTIFSCFMTSCLIGSTLFGFLQRLSYSIENTTTIMLLIATAAMTGMANLESSNLCSIILIMFLYEICVGVYFPSIGTLRSRYLPEQHRSVLMNIFGIPLNLIVILVMLTSQYLGTKGALNIASLALGTATLFMFSLNKLTSKVEKNKEVTHIN